MEGPGWAAEPSGGADGGAGEPRWPQPPEEGTDHQAEPRCETPPAGPQPIPTGLLAYRPESSQANVHHEAEENAEPTREYCGNLQRPLPFSEDVPLSEEDRFCCERSRELCEFIMERQRLEDASSLPRAVGTYESVGSEANLLLSNDKENWRQQKRRLIIELADQSLKPSATKGRTPVPVVSAAEPELRLENEPEPEPWPEEESEKEPQLENEPEPEPWPEEESEKEPQLENKPEPDPWPEEESEKDPQLKNESEPEPWLENEAEPELWLENKPKPEPWLQNKPEPEPWPKEELEPEPQLKNEPEAELWLENKPKPELWPEEEPEPEPWPEEEPEKEPHPEEKPEPEPQPEEKPEPEPQPEEKPELEPWPKEELEPEPRPKKEPRPKPKPRHKKEPRPKPKSWHKEEPEQEPEHDKEPMSRSVLGYDFSLMGKKVGKAKLVQKYYKNGKKFLTMLPDGTSQLFYPSGNLAIIITQERDQHSLIVQEDELKTAKIRALFQSDGRSTCYYRNGDEWINMSIQGGQYLDQAGNRVRRWMWLNLSPEPHVPLSPIFISLNRHVGVRILAQDKIFVSFLAMGRQAKFNMGTKVQDSTASQLSPPAQLGEDELLLLAFRVRILQLFDRMRGCLNFPSTEHWNKMQPPMYLVTQAVKILELCMAADISDELRNSIRAIVNAQQL